MSFPLKGMYMRPVATAFSRLGFVVRSLGGFMTLLELLTLVLLVIVVVAPNETFQRITLGVVAVVALAGIGYQVFTDREANNNLKLRLGFEPLLRISLALVATAVAFQESDSLLLGIAATVLVGLIVGEKAMLRPIRSATPQVANLPGTEVALPSTNLANIYFATTTLGVALLVLTAVVGLAPVMALVVAAIATVLGLMVGLQAVRFLVQRNRLEANLPKILDDLAPAFAFHWQAPAGTAYQAAMWLPYLARLGTPYFILARTKANFHELSKMTDAPVILRVGLEDLDPVVRPSLKVVFYANTAVRNSHMIRFPRLTHIQLNHGDSDKIASVSPTFRQYDRNFVAGQAAVDRFAKHGVATIPEQFEIVGRPQLENVQQAAGPISDVQNPTVLYSPTWSGFYDDSDYSSLSAGPAIVQALLDRGCTVIFRPHPYARRHKGNLRSCGQIIELLEQDKAASGREHLYGEVAETTLSVFDCFNAADAMISDVSSVVSDFLISSKPFAMAAVSAHGEAFVDEFPMARAAYVIDVHKKQAENVAEIVGQMLSEDPKAEIRRSLRDYYLSDTPPERIAERFVEVARRYL